MISFYFLKELKGNYDDEEGGEPVEGASGLRYIYLLIWKGQEH